MANVDSKLFNTTDRSPADRSSEKPKRALRGAAGGIYIGPVLSTAAIGDSSIAHATGAAGGGVEDSTGYRESDTYTMGTDVTAATARSTGRTMYRADGTFGGSVPGYPAQRTGQRAAAASGSSLSAEGNAAAFIDKRSNIYGDGGVALGQAGRGTRVLAGTVVTGGVGQGTQSGTPRIPRPTVEDSDAPAAGVVGIIAGDDLFTCDLHADDITGGANGLAGCTVVGYLRGSDTDEDSGDPVFKASFDSTTEANLVTGLASATAYAMYVQFKDTAGNLGPMSARFVNTTT
jgi:hypothetical protein